VLLVEYHLLGSQLYRFFPLRMDFTTA
jgi:hypothetical protein